jgi:hypothetical protein
MDLSRLGRGQLVAAIGGLLLLVSLFFLEWYDIGANVETGFGTVEVSGEFGAWDRQGFLGTLANLVILAAGLAAVALAVLTAMSRTVALPVAASALTAALGIAASVFVFLRMLFQPGPNGLVDLKFNIFLALFGAIAVAVGGWQGMQEEGTSFGEARDDLQERFGRETEARPRPAPRQAPPTEADAPGTTAPPPPADGPTETPPP